MKHKTPLLALILAMLSLAWTPSQVVAQQRVATRQNLPRAQSSDQLSLVVTIKSDGGYLLNKKEVNSLSQLGTLLSEALFERPADQKMVSFRAPLTMKYGKVVEVIDVIKMSGGRPIVPLSEALNEMINIELRYHPIKLAGVEVDLPQARNPDEDISIHFGSAVVISVPEVGVYGMKQSKFTKANSGYRQQLVERINDGSKGIDPNSELAYVVYIRCGSDVPYSEVVALMQVALEVSRDRVILVTERKSQELSEYSEPVVADNTKPPSPTLSRPIRYLVSRKSSTTRNGKLNDALLNAADRGQIAKVRELIRAGADVNARVKEPNCPGCPGLTPLILAIDRGYTDVAEVLIKARADVRATAEFGITALSKALRLPRDERTKVITSLINAGANINEMDMYGYTALSVAAGRGDIEMVQTLIQFGANVNGGGPPSGTALRAAVSSRRANIVSILIRAGADVNAEEGAALSEAVKNGDLEIVRLLIQSAPNLNSAGGVALRAAASQGKIPIVRELIRMGVSVDARGSDGTTALMEAAASGGSEIVLLLIRAGANVNSANRKGWTPLMLAASKDNLEVIADLILAGADLNAKNQKGDTVWLVAKDTMAEKYLEQALQGKPPNVEDVTDADFEKKVLRTRQPILVFFWGEETAPERLLTPNIEYIAEEYVGKAKVVRYNVARNTKVSSQYGIRKAPALILFRDGKELERIVGVNKDTFSLIRVMMGRHLR